MNPDRPVVMPYAEGFNQAPSNTGKTATPMLSEYIQSVCRFNSNVRLFLAQIFIVGIYSGIYGVVFNLYVLEKGFGTDFLGLLLSVSLLATSVASIPAGILCDRFNRKKLIVASSFLSAVAILPLFLFHSPVVLLAASAISGIMSSITLVCATPFLTDNCEQDDAVHVFSASSALTWMAAVIGCVLGGVIPGLWRLLNVPGNAYQLTLLASMTLVFAGCVFLLFLRENKCTTRHIPNALDWKPSFSPATIKFTAISVIIGAGSGMIVPYFNVYFTRIVHASVLQTGIIFAIADIFMVLGFIAIPYLSRRIGRARSAVITQAASLPFLILMAISTNFLMASIAYVMRMFLMNMASPATTSLQMETIRPDERGFAVGLMSTGNSFAIAATTYISGLLMAGGNYWLPFIVTTVAYLAACVLLYHYFGHEEKLQPAGASGA